MSSSPSPDLSKLYGDAILHRTANVPLSWLDNPSCPGSGIIPLGQNDDPSHGLAWSLKDIQGHAVTIGPTRCGKGVSSLIPAALTYGGSLVLVDTKAENAWVTAPRRRMMGQRTRILDPWNEVNRRYANGEPVEEITTFNPLAELDPKSSEFADDLMELADALIVNTSSNDPYWDNASRDFCAGIMGMVVEVDGADADLPQVRKILTYPVDKLQATIANFVALHPDSVASRKLASFISSKENEKEQSSVRSSARTHTNFLDSGKLSEHLGTETAFLDDPDLARAPNSTFRMSDLLREPTTLYLVLPPSKLNTHSRWLRLMLTLVVRAVTRNAIPTKDPVLMLIDEMGTIGRLSIIEQAYGQAAGMGLRIWSYLQDMSQLKRDYPETWETFLDNADVVQILEARDITGSEWVSAFLGNTTVEEIRGQNLVTRPYYLNQFQIDYYKWWLGKYGEEFVCEPNPPSGAVPRPIKAVVPNLDERLTVQSSPNGYFISQTRLELDVIRHERPLISPQDIRKLPETHVLNILKGKLFFLTPRIVYYTRLAHWVRPIPLYDTVPNRPNIKTTLQKLGRPEVLVMPAPRQTAPPKPAAVSYDQKPAPAAAAALPTPSPVPPSHVAASTYRADLEKSLAQWQEHLTRDPEDEATQEHIDYLQRLLSLDLLESELAQDEANLSLRVKVNFLRNAYGISPPLEPPAWVIAAEAVSDKEAIRRAVDHLAQTEMMAMQHPEDEGIKAVLASTRVTVQTMIETIRSTSPYGPNAYYRCLMDEPENPPAAVAPAPIAPVATDNPAPKQGFFKSAAWGKK